MTAIQQVKAALTDAIAAAGVSAVGAYSEETLKKYQTAVAAVGTREMSVTHAGAAEYLGERYDAQRGTAERWSFRSRSTSTRRAPWARRAVRRQRTRSHR